jgi:hypothetical protein
MSEIPRLALIVGAARSGTTLTRLLLDAHPDIGCPPEAGIPALMAHMAQVWSTVHADDPTLQPGHDPGAPARGEEAVTKWGEPHEGPADRGADESAVNLPPAVREWVVNTVRAPMDAYCRARGKRIYCDKSLDSVRHLPVVRELFPDVKVLLIFRHVMDTVASGLEASPWGFNAYGYGPYVQVSPGNSVAALANYWLDHVDQALNWEQRHGGHCHRVTYEELVLRPEETVAEILRFLDVSADLSILDRAFERGPARGPGDFKVEYTTGIHAASIGHGKRVPVGMLPPRLVEALNEKLSALGYEPLDLGWNAAERLVDGQGHGFWAGRLTQLMREAHIDRGVSDLGSFAVLADDHRPLRWVVEPGAGTIVQGDGDVDAVITATAEDLVRMLSGDENLGVLLRSGRVRHVTAEKNDRPPSRLVDEVNAQVAILRGALRPHVHSTIAAVQ